MNEDSLSLVCIHLLFVIIILLFRFWAKRKKKNLFSYSTILILYFITIFVTVLSLFNIFSDLHATDGFVVMFFSFIVGCLLFVTAIVIFLIQLFQKKSIREHR